MPPTVRAVNEASGEGASGNPTFTNPALAGDLVLVLCIGAGAGVFTPPAGEGFGAALVSNAPGGADQCELYTKIEDASPPASYAFTSGQANASGLIAAIATPGEGILEDAFTNGASSTATDFPDLTSPATNVLSLLLTGWDHTNTGTPSNSTPTDYAEDADFSSASALLVSAMWSRAVGAGTITPADSTKDQAQPYTAIHLLVGSLAAARGSRTLLGVG